MFRMRSLSLLMCLVVVLTTGGSLASWIFSQNRPKDEDDSLGIILNEFTWAPDEILPTETPGENYMDLLESILNNSKGGLNSSKGTVEKAVNDYNFVHSSQNVQGGNLKHLFITEPCKLLEFVIQRVSAKEFHVYMFEILDAEAATVNVTRIKVYKTILIEQDNGKWYAPETQQGHAIARYFKSTTYHSINPEEWVIGGLPKFQ